jgi:hypothetical protein
MITANSTVPTFFLIGSKTSRLPVHHLICCRELEGKVYNVFYSSIFLCPEPSQNALDIVPGEYTRGWVRPNGNNVAMEVWVVLPSLHAIDIQLLVSVEKENLILILQNMALMQGRVCKKRRPTSPMLQNPKSNVLTKLSKNKLRGIAMD